MSNQFGHNIRRVTRVLHNNIVSIFKHLICNKIHYLSSCLGLMIVNFMTSRWPFCKRVPNLVGNELFSHVNSCSKKFAWLLTT